MCTVCEGGGRVITEYTAADTPKVYHVVEVAPSHHVGRQAGGQAGRQAS